MLYRLTENADADADGSGTLPKARFHLGTWNAAIILSCSLYVSQYMFYEENDQTVNQCQF